MIITEILSNLPKKENERDLRYFRRCNFMALYYRFDEKRVDRFESLFVKREFKELLLELDVINNNIWKIAKIRRGVSEWNESYINYLYKFVFDTLMRTKDVYAKLINLINMERPIWQNMIINVLATYKLNKDDVYEIMPYNDMESLKLLFRQIFTPVINLLTDIENSLLTGEVDEDKLRELENVMLLSVLPYFEDVYENVIKLQDDVLW